MPPLIKWHLTSTDGPLHYVANAVYQPIRRESAEATAADIEGAEVVEMYVF